MYNIRTWPERMKSENRKQAETRKPNVVILFAETACTDPTARVPFRIKDFLCGARVLGRY
jgi:hypothetical protein